MIRPGPTREKPQSVSHRMCLTECVLQRCLTKGVLQGVFHSVRLAWSIA